jgi:hypothetical protein
MAILASKVSIISQAYFLLGKEPINTLNTTDPTDVGASQRYDVVVPTLLTNTHWKHAAKVIDLTKTTDKPPINEWQYTFQLPNPAEMLLIYRVYPDNFTYDIIGDKLYSNNSRVTLFYIYDPDEKTFPMYFVNYIVYTMAAELALTVTQKSTLEELWRKRAQEAGVIATALDYQQAPNPSIIYDSLERAHGGAIRYRGLV